MHGPLTPRTIHAIFSIFSVCPLSIIFNSHRISKVLYPVWRRKGDFTSLRSDNLSRIYFNILDAIKNNFALQKRYRDTYKKCWFVDFAGEI